MIRIQVPATSANLGSGFDSLGIALTMYNQVWMEEYDGIDIRSRDGIKVPTDEKNLIYWSAKRLYEECGKKLPGLKIDGQRAGEQLGLYCGGIDGGQPVPGQSVDLTGYGKSGLPD